MPEAEFDIHVVLEDDDFGDKETAERHVLEHVRPALDAGYNEVVSIEVNLKER